MGRIRLEWDIETQKIEKSDSEDPQTKWARRRNLLRLFLLIAIILGIAVGGILFVQNRLDEVDRELDQLLRDTVQAEVAAIRIGDFDTFINLQRSATDEWLNTQQLIYQNYEQLKVNNDVKLTGNVLATEIEGQRGRAIVEEIIDGVPYAHVWFYWRYTDGWRHVPPDLTFWGEDKVIESENIQIRYRTVDELFAEQINDAVPNWLIRGCEILQCPQTPQLTIEIVPDTPEPIIWVDELNWLIRLQSPYVTGARADSPFDIQRQILFANTIAERLMNQQTNYMAVNSPHDVVHLQQAVVGYLVEQFIQIDTNSLLMESIVTQYGEDKISQLVSLFAPTADMTIIQQVVPAPLGQANLDWRDFITWRLSLENNLITSRSEAEWLNLYDTSDETVRIEAYNRYTNGILMEQPIAIDQQVQTSASGLPQLRFTIRVGTENTFRDDIVLFNLINNIWKRAS